MNQPLLLTTLGLFFGLAAMERLAARAHQINQASWHGHYATVPPTAVVTAELRWNAAQWITAYVETSAPGADTLHVVGLPALSERDRSACLRWLRAEGFADATACRAPGDFNRWIRESGA